jgi:hypothetical protein
MLLQKKQHGKIENAERARGSHGGTGKGTKNGKEYRYGTRRKSSNVDDEKFFFEFKSKFFGVTTVRINTTKGS